MADEKELMLQCISLEKDLMEVVGRYGHLPLILIKGTVALFLNNVMNDKYVHLFDQEKNDA